MEIKVTKEKDNVFFKRKDLVLDIIHEGASTPKTEDLKKELANRYRVDESQVIPIYITTKSGLSESIAKVKILDEKPVVVEEKKPAEVEEKKPEEKPKKEEKPKPKEEKPKEKKEDAEKKSETEKKKTEKPKETEKTREVENKEGVRNETQKSKTK